MDVPEEQDAAIARRKAIQAIMKDASLSQPEKQQQIQALMSGNAAPTSAASKPIGQENSSINATSVRSQLSSLEEDVSAKQKGRAPSASRPGAVAVASTPGGGGGIETGLSTLERDVLAKKQGGNLDPAVADAQPAAGQQELSQLERDVQAKERARATGATATMPGALQGGLGALSQLELDVQAKQRAMPSGASVPGSHPAGQGELSQIERDIQAKQRGRPTAASVPGAQSAGQGALSQLERDVQEKERARPTGASMPGAQAAGQGALSQLERDVQAKQRARPTGASMPGAQAAGQGELSQMERDIEAKQRARPTGASMPGSQPGGHGELSQLERDVQAKQRAAGGLSPAAAPGAHQAAYADVAPASGLSQLERDIQAKQRARPTGVPDSNPAAGLSQLESDVAAKQRAARPAAADASPGGYSSAGHSELSQLESDVTAKNRARPMGAATAPGAQATVGGGRSELGSFESDVMAKNRARADRDAAMSPSLSTLEQDVMAKNQARAPPAASAGYSPGARELSSLEQDVAAKSRARPTCLMASDVLTVGAAATSGMNDLYALENSIGQKSGYGGIAPPPSSELSPLFANVAASGRSMHEIARLDERIAQKSSPSAPQQELPRQMAYDDGRRNSPVQNERSFENPNPSDEHTKSGGYVGKGDYPDDGIERARDDKEGYAGDGRTPGGEGGIPAPAGDMEYGEINLAVATAIEEDEEEMFIPAAVQFDPDAKPPIYKNRRFRLYGIAGLFFIIAVIVVAVVITQVSDSGPNGPTMAPTTYRESLGIELQISEVFGSDYLADPTSTQSKAVEWLINEDPYQITPDAENLIQRFILVFFYFQTSQEGDWISCGKPEGDQPDSCYYMFLTNTYADPWQYEELYWTRWLTGTHECDWAGITCHSDKVTDIALDGYRLAGAFPLELTKLDYLRDISLTHNKLRGTLPRELAQMKHLTDIELQRNQFTGTVPDEWFGAKNLIHINFATNEITGTLPSEFGLLTDLQRFFIQNNLLTGTIPLEIFTMTSLKWIFMGNNKIGGSFPTELGQLTNLEYFYSEGNPLTGTLPSEIAKLTEMRELDLHDTMLSGTISEEMLRGMAEMLNVLDFTNANFEGTLSTRLGLLHNMNWFLFGENNFSGAIPEQVGNMELVNRFQVQGNKLTGSIPMSLCMHRGIGTLSEVIADCASISTGETPVYCPPGCCSECCNQDTGICLPATT